MYGGVESRVEFLNTIDFVIWELRATRGARIEGTAKDAYY